jgi:hypothetical protein
MSKRSSRKHLKHLAGKLQRQQAYREYHDDMDRLQQRCRAVKPDGTPCQAQPLAGGYYCKAHTPK